MKRFSIVTVLLIIYISLIAQTGCDSETKASDEQKGRDDQIAQISDADENKGKDNDESITSDDTQSKPKSLTTQEFKELVFDFVESPQEWKFEGDLPVIVDFYADWCKPCKMIAPTLEKLQKEYEGKIRIYKIDTDKNTELANFFQIRSIPALLFIPMEGQPQMYSGALPEETFKQLIQEVLKVEN